MFSFLSKNASIISPPAWGHRDAHAFIPSCVFMRQIFLSFTFTSAILFSLNNNSSAVSSILYHFIFFTAKKFFNKKILLYRDTLFGTGFLPCLKWFAVVLQCLFFLLPK